MRNCSHICPSLSNLAFTIVERSWTQVLKEILDPPTFPFFAIRYVDNRYLFCPRALHTSLIFEDIQWNWRKSPRMNCWVFLLILTFRTVTYKLPQPRPPVFPPPVGRSPPGVSNTALPSFRFFEEIQAHNRFFPLYRHLCFATFSSSHGHLAADPRSRNYSHISPSLSNLSSYHCRTFMDPSLPRSTWPSIFSVFWLSDTWTIGMFYFPRRSFKSHPYKFPSDSASATQSRGHSLLDGLEIHSLGISDQVHVHNKPLRLQFWCKLFFMDVVPRH